MPGHSEEGLADPSRERRRPACANRGQDARAPGPSQLMPSAPALLHSLSHLLFAAFLLLTLSTRSLWLRSNPSFDQPPLQRLAEQAGSFSLPLLLAVLTSCAWLAWRVLERPRRPWRWGAAPVALPLLALALLVLTRLDLASDRAEVAQIPKLVAFSAFVYLFVLDEKPNVLPPLAFAVLCQGAVALLQFLSQGDLGLRALGELPLSTNLDAISILWVEDRAWIRGYGLTDHPNLLGTMLAVSLLILIEREVRGRMREFRSMLLVFVVGIGFLGLLATFSRAAWLGFLAGLVVFLLPRRFEGILHSKRHAPRRTFPIDTHAAGEAGGGRRGLALWAILGRRGAWMLALLLVSALFLFPYRELLGARLLIVDSPVEARSLDERLRDARLALDLVAAHPLVGVGPGRYDEAARLLDPHALTVHDVPLLVAAELGLPAAALWLWLALYPFISRLSNLDPRLAPWAAWVVNGLFDPNPWPLSILSSAVLFGLLAARLAGSCDGRLKEAPR